MDIPITSGNSLENVLESSNLQHAHGAQPEAEGTLTAGTRLRQPEPVRCATVGTIILLCVSTMRVLLMMRS